MADGTRLQQEQKKLLEETLKAMMDTMNTKMEELHNSFNNRMDKEMGDMKEMLGTLHQQSMFHTTAGGNNLDKGSGSFASDSGRKTYGTGHENSPNSTLKTSKSVKIEFPRFWGEDVKGWLYRCEQFFAIDGTVDEQGERAKIASVHLEGKALQWHQAYMRSRGALGWPVWGEYSTAALERFSDELFDDPMMELKNLRQRGTVREYQEEFETIVNRIEVLPGNLALSCFLGGLKEEIQISIRMFNPQSLQQALGLAKLQEAAVLAQNKRSKPLLPTPKPFPVFSPLPSTSKIPAYIQQSKPSQMTQNTSPKPYNNPHRPTKTIPYKVMEEKRQKGLCFYCDEKYERGHKCKQPQLYNLEVVWEGDASEGEEGSEQGQEGEEPEQGDSNEEERPFISVHALNGLSSFKTIRVTGFYKKQALHILIDSGSTHNFLDLNFAKRAGCKISPSEPLQVGVADGRGVVTSSICKGFTWCLQGEKFMSDVMLLPLGGCDMVLGVQWLITLGPVQFDFQQLKIEFQHKGRRFILRGTGETLTGWMKGKRAHKALNALQGQLFAIQVMAPDFAKVKP